MDEKQEARGEKKSWRKKNGRRGREARNYSKEVRGAEGRGKGEWEKINERKKEEKKRRGKEENGEKTDITESSREDKRKRQKK